MIADRYEILDLIGQGGMADVYLAKDTILNRTIAIKVLRTGLAKDPVYVTRFQREASAAAALAHKNIVEIYDVGEDGNQYYIVMEHVPGTTLKELINKRGALHVAEAIDIMKQVIEGTVKAHQLGIVHRDLKPQNILVTDSGTAKIADFGIASMQSLAQVTQTDVIMGSLHYLAPELARGEKATNQSDIYALGIVFYELLRGEVPFNGESPVNIALKHMQEELPSICEFNDSIPQSVENMIIKATAKNLNNRYQNIKEMLDDITTCMEREEEKLVFPYDQNDNPTIILDPRSGYSDRTGELQNPESEQQNKSSKGLIAKLKSLPLAAKIGIGIATAAVLGGLIFLLMSGNGAEVSMMPDITGLTMEEAMEVLEEYDVEISEDINEELSEEYEAELIISTDPKAGRTITSDTVVSITISKGKYIRIKDYVGEPFETAKAELEAQGFTVRVTYQTSNERAGTVLEQSVRANTNIDPDEAKEITLTVSQGSAIVIDNYVGMTIEQARLQLSALGFTVTVSEVESDQTAGIVTAQSRPPNTSFEPGSSLTITLTVSKGRSFEIPNVIGQNYQSAAAHLRSLGYNVEFREGDAATSRSQEGNVYSQTPAAGSVFESTNRTITLVYYGAYESQEMGGNED